MWCWQYCWERFEYLNKTDRQTDRQTDSVLVTLLPCKSYKYYRFWVCVCSPRCTACNAQGPYFHMRPVQPYHNFPHYLMNGTTRISLKPLLNTKCVEILCTNFVRNISHSQNNSARFDQNSKLVFMQLFFSEFSGPWIFSTDFRKVLKYQIAWKSV